MKRANAAVGRGFRFRVVAASVLVAVWGISPGIVRAADLLVDHVEYIRAAGVAQAASLFFPGCDPQGTYTLTVTNGQDEAHRATGGSVSVNGVELVAPADFGQSPAPAQIVRAIAGVGERNTLALSVTAPQGSIIGWRVTAEVTCPEITIDDPPLGSVINRGEITVRGRVRHRTPEVGVIVNGVLAHVNGNYWVANNVSLGAGGNTLSAEARDENGETATVSHVVSQLDSVEGGIRIEAYSASGTAPLEATFVITNATGRAIAEYQVDFGDGATATLTEPAEAAHRYVSEGIFPVVVTARDADGVLRQDGTSVNVHALPPLKTRWEKMKAAVVSGDIAGALRNFTEPEARVQERIFGALGAGASTMVAQMQDIGLVYLEGDRAQCRIRRNELVDGVEMPITYYIGFIRDQDGFWKIDSF